MRCRRDLGEIRARCRRGEIAGEGEIQARSRREIHRPRCPCGAAREGRARGQPTQTARAARVRVAGPARPLAHGKDLRAKSKGAGSASHQASPTLRHRGNGPATSSGRRLRLPGGARRSRPCGWGRPRPRAPPRAAPTRRPSSAIRTTAAGRAESVMSVTQRAEEERGEHRACASPTMSRNSGSSAKRQRVIAVMGLMMSRTTRQVGQCQQLCLIVNATSHQIGNERACLVVERKEESRALGRPEASY